jgi:hypothetical protein
MKVIELPFLCYSCINKIYLGGLENLAVILSIQLSPQCDIWTSGIHSLFCILFALATRFCCLQLKYTHMVMNYLVIMICSGVDSHCEGRA